MNGPGPDGRRAGFLLFEVLVAVAVAGMLLPALARAFGQAWITAAAPLEAVSGLSLARDATSGPPSAVPPGFRVSRREEAITVRVLPSDVPPAPRADLRPPTADAPGSASGSAAAPATPSTMHLAIPQTFGTPSSPAGEGAATPPALRRIAVTVTGPSGRRWDFDGIRRDAAPSP